MLAVKIAQALGVLPSLDKGNTVCYNFLRTSIYCMKFGGEAQFFCECESAVHILYCIQKIVKPTFEFGQYLLRMLNPVGKRENQSKDKGVRSVKKGLTATAVELASSDSIYFGATAQERGRFAEALGYVTELENLRGGRVSAQVGNSVGIEGGTNIGGLGERTLHLVLKYMAEPDRAYHEVRCGRFFADIMREDGIIEVQTRNLYSMKKKLAEFAAMTCGGEPMSVTVIHPIVESKTLIWVEPETGELSGFRKSPKREGIYGAFREISSLGEVLALGNVGFILPVLCCDEYKLKCGRSRDGKKFGAARLNRIPTEYIGEYRFTCPRDFLRLLPVDLLSAPFTVKSLCSSLGIDSRSSYSLLRTLSFSGVIRKCGKLARADLYEAVL